MHVTHCHFGESSKLESREIFKTHPPEEPLKIAPQPRVQVAAFRPILRHGRGGVGPSGITCDCKLLRVGSTCRRVVRQVCTTPHNNHILSPACDCARGGSFLRTEATQSIAACLTSTLAVSVQPVEKGGMGVWTSGQFTLANVSDESKRVHPPIPCLEAIGPTVVEKLRGDDAFNILVLT